MHVGEPAFGTVVAEGELRVIEAEEVQQRGVLVAAHRRIHGNLEGKLITFAIRPAAMDAAACASSESSRGSASPAAPSPPIFRKFRREMQSQN